MNAAPADAPPAQSRAVLIGGVVLLAALIFAFHGRSLDDGLFMDDWAHFRQLRAADWSLAGLTDACRLELVGGIADVWWLPECTLRFFRPVAFAVMKLTYTLGDWNPAVMHVASLLWHTLASTLIMLLLRRLGFGAVIAWTAAALFALHPGHVATVQWLACQTELMVTVLLIGATLCWGRFRGWPGFAPARQPVGQLGHPGWFIGTCILFVAALGCRENAVMFPFVLAVAEPIVGGWRRRGVLLVYGVFALTLGAYLATRTHYLHGVALPPPPYVVPPTDPDFPRWIFDKLGYYLLSEFFFVPCVPIGGIPYFRERPEMFYPAVAAAFLLLGWLLYLARQRRGIDVLGPAWLVAFFVPLLPAFSSPHHLYLPGVGWAVCAAMIVRAMFGWVERLTAWRRTWLTAARLGVFLLGGGLATMTYYCGLALDVGQAVEDCTIDEMARTPLGLHDGDTLYVGNLPLLAHYAQLALEERTGLHLRVIPLTWSPRLLGPATPTELVPIDDHTLELRVAEDRYFGGPLGILMRSAAGQSPSARAASLHRDDFRVEVLAEDTAGVQALRFVFARPLTSPGLHLFWCSRARWAFDVPVGWRHASE